MRRGQRSRRETARVDVVGRPPDGFDPGSLDRLIGRALDALGQPDGRLTVRFACDRTVRRYNRVFRGVDRATDVLSFVGDVPGPPVTYLGDLLVSRERVRVQAAHAGLTSARETEELVLHGLLHLLGHDHEHDDGQMDALELDLRRRVLDPAEVRREST